MVSPSILNSFYYLFIFWFKGLSFKTYFKIEFWPLVNRSISAWINSWTWNKLVNLKGTLNTLWVGIQIYNPKILLLIFQTRFWLLRVFWMIKRSGTKKVLVKWQKKEKETDDQRHGKKKANIGDDGKKVQMICSPSDLVGESNWLLLVSQRWRY